MANDASEKEERINQIQCRVDELDRLLARYVQPAPADNRQTASSAEMDYWSDRLEERRLLLEELEELFQEGKAQD